MNKKRLYILRASVALMFFGAFFIRCASIMTPTGGPKDTLPPYIVRIDPGNFTTNFDQKKIYVEFNEYIQLKDQQKELFTSPAMKKMPSVFIKGKGIQITIKDTLKENTTYAIDFGSAIRDNNEGNPLNAMRYVFSTGAEIDSLMCTGYTEDSYKADSVSKAFIYFYIADSLPDTPDYDSTLFNRKPDVIARSQNNGIFIAQNLKPVDYRIYAIGDKNDNKLYDAGTDLVGVLDGVYNPAKLPEFAIWFDSLRMYPSAEPQLYFRMFTDVTFKGQRLVESSRPLQKKLLLYFNTAHPQIEELQLDSIPSDKILWDAQTKGKDTVALWLNVPAENLPDTIKGSITYFKHDSIRQLQKTTEKLKLYWKEILTKEQEKERDKEEKERKKAEAEGREYTAPEKPNPFKCTLSIQSEINPEDGFNLKTDFPLIEFDTASIQLLRITEQNEIPVKASYRRDTMDLCKWYVDAKWMTGTKYRYYIPKKSMTDIMGYQNDSISMDFATYDPEKFATLTIKVKAQPGSKYIIQQTDANGRTQKELKDVTQGVYHIRYVPAGEIRYRIIEDKNGNGIWDAGNVIQRLQPERTEMYLDEKGEGTFVTKVNWEIETIMDMDRIFAPVTMKSLQKTLDEKEKSRLKKLYEEALKKASEHRNESNGSSQGMGMGGMGMGGGLGGMTGGLGGMTGGLSGGRMGGM